VTNYLEKGKKRTPADALAAWREMEKKERKKWNKTLEKKQQQFTDDYAQVSVLFNFFFFVANGVAKECLSVTSLFTGETTSLFIK